MSGISEECHTSALASGSVEGEANIAAPEVVALGVGVRSAGNVGGLGDVGVVGDVRALCTVFQKG